MILLKDKDHIDMVEILSIKKDYARIMTKGETIDIPIYISEENTFFTRKENIVDARIESEKDQLAIQIAKIKNQKQRVTYQNKTYYLFYLEINFDDVYTLGLKLGMLNSNMIIDYNNDESLTLELGDINLLFHEISGSNHIDYSRMYSIHDQDQIIGIYIELINQTGQNINLLSIDLLNEKMHLNLNDAKIVYNHLNHLKTLEEIIPGYQSIVSDFPAPKAFSFTHNTALFIPMNYLNTYNHLNRFPMMISYEYNGNLYDYIIDDYLFYSHVSDLYNDLYDIQTYQYHYS